MADSAKPNARILAGECFCRAVSYAVADEFGYALNCHCSNCRRTTGAAFKPFAGIARDKFSVTRGEDDLMIHGNEIGHDAHCRKCGSLLYSVVREGAFVHVAMGTLVDDPSIRPTAHIFVGSKASWVRDHGRPAAIPGARRAALSGSRCSGNTCSSPEVYIRTGTPRKRSPPWPNRRGAGPTKDIAMARFTLPWIVT